MVDKSISEKLIRDYQKRIKKLEDKTDRLEHIFHNAQIGIFHLSHKGKIIFSNPEIHKLCGYSSLENFHSISDIGKDLFADYKDKDSLLKILQNEKTTNRFITKFKKDDGTNIDVSIDASTQTYLTDNYIEFYVQEFKDDKLFGKHNHFLSSVVEQLAEGMAIADMDANLLFANSKWISMHGYENEEKLIGKTLSIFHNKKQIEEDVKPFNLKVKEKGHHSGEVGHIRKDGSIFPTRMTTTLLRDENDVPYAIAGVATDITDQKHSENALMESESRYRLLFDLLPYGGEIISTKGKILNCSKSTAKMLGYEVSELIGKNITSLLDPDSVKIFKEKSKVLLSGKPQSAEICMIRKDGAKLNVLRAAQPITNTDGKIESIIALSVDITMRKKAENILKEREQWLSTTLKSIGDAVISTDEKGIVTYMNPIAEDLTGWELNEAEGERLCDVFKIVNAQTKKTAENPVNMVLTTGNIVGLANHTMLISKDGTEYQIADSGAPIKDVNDSIIGVVLVFRDVTGQYGMQKALEESENNLRALFNAMTDVVFEMDYNGTYLNIAPTSPEHIFKPSEEAIGKTLHDLFPKPEADKFLGFIRKCLDENKILTIEYPLVIQDKTTWFQGRATPKTENSVFYIATDITERKQAEINVKKSEQKYRALFEGINDAVFVHILEDEGFSNFIEVNKIACAQLGYSREELLNLSAKDISVPEEVKKRSSKKSKKELLKDKWWVFETVHISKSGNQFPVEISSRVFEMEGKPVIMSLARDITDRKQSEKALRQSEAKYRGLIESSGDWIWEVNAEGVYTYASPQVDQILGYTPEEVIGKTPFDLMPPEDSKKIKTIFMEFIEAGKSIVSVENINRHKDGHQLVLETSGVPIFDENGKIVGYQGVDRDITERKQTEKTIQEQLLHSQALNRIAKVVSSENKPDVILETTATIVGETLKTDRTIIYNVDFNEGKIIGLSEWLNNKEHEISPTLNTFEITVFGDAIKWLWENRSYIDSHFDKIATPLEQDGSGKLLHNQMKIKSGLWIPFDFRDDGFHVLVFNQVQYRRTWQKTELDFVESVTGQINIALQKISYFHELTGSVNHIQQINTKLGTALKRAEESDRLKSSFLANMSHEIRTPMNGILGFASLLKERSLSGEEQQKYIDIIENSGKRMLNIINDLINISKIESGQIKVSLSETDLNKQIEYIYTFFKPEAEKKGIQLSILNILPHTKSVIKTDREKIYAILTNLVKNAIKYTEAGFIEIGYNLKASGGDTKLEFFVKDTGIGIAKSKQKLIFDRFVQADLSLSSNYEGAGLGLSISKAYAEMLDGEIGVESEEGIGSRFYFTIPYLIKGQEKIVLREINNKTEKDTQSKNLNILIAEDEKTSRAYLSIIVKDIGKKIIYAENGLEAVKLCQENKDIDLILMDIKMPEMDGLIATSLIREFNKDVIIIAQTAYALPADREKAIKSGCNDYITKPIIKEDLLAIIDNHF